MEQKFYQKTWFIWLMLIFLFPVGLFLLFKYSDYSMKTKGIITVVILALAAYSVAHKPAEQPKQAPAQQVAAVEQKTDTKVCDVAGLGDTKDRFADEHHSPSTDSGMMASYQTDGLTVVFDENKRAINITITAEPKGKIRPTVAKMVPSDAAIENATTDKSDPALTKDHKNGHSEKLKAACPASNGDFEIIDVYDTQTMTYLHTVIGTK
jgi:hypothetical protein